MKLPFNIDLNGKVAVVTGAGGVLMSEFAKALAESGAKVALLDINEAAVVIALTRQPLKAHTLRLPPSLVR